MTVTELREALQALEAQGHGELRCVVYEEWKDRTYIEDANPRIETLGKFVGDALSPPGSTIVVL